MFGDNSQSEKNLAFGQVFLLADNCLFDKLSGAKIITYNFGACQAFSQIYFFCCFYAPGTILAYADQIGDYCQSANSHQKANDCLSAYFCLFDHHKYAPLKGAPVENLNFSSTKYAACACRASGKPKFFKFIFNIARVK